MQEEEARLRPGSKKAIVFETLKVVGSGGVSVVNLLQAVRQHREWSEAEGDKKILHMVTPPRRNLIGLPCCKLSPGQLFFFG